MKFVCYMHAVWAAVEATHITERRTRSRERKERKRAKPKNNDESLIRENGLRFSLSVCFVPIAHNISFYVSVRCALLFHWIFFSVYVLFGARISVQLLWFLVWPKINIIHCIPVIRLHPNCAGPWKITKKIIYLSWFRCNRTFYSESAFE